MITYVKQRDSHDCGVAALAMLCGVTYAEAESAIPNYKKGRGTRTKQLVEGAAKLGYRALGKRLRPLRNQWSAGWRGIENNSLVKVPHPQGQNWHWVVWRDDVIYDPARGVFKPLFYPGGIPKSRLRFVAHGVQL